MKRKHSALIYLKKTIFVYTLTINIILNNSKHVIVHCGSKQIENVADKSVHLVVNSAPFVGKIQAKNKGEIDMYFMEAKVKQD